MLISGSTFAAFLKNVPVKINQPDGTALNVFASGDEYYYRMHDAENYTITRDPLTGYYVYASILNDELVPTDYVLGEIDPHLTELQAGICISSTKWAQLRHDFWENTPAKTTAPSLLKSHYFKPYFRNYKKKMQKNLTKCSVVC